MAIPNPKMLIDKKTGQRYIWTEQAARLERLVLEFTSKDIDNRADLQEYALEEFGVELDMRNSFDRLLKQVQKLEKASWKHRQ